MLWKYIVSLTNQVFPNIVAVWVMFVWHNRRIIRKFVEKIDDGLGDVKEHVSREVGNNTEDAGTVQEGTVER